MTEIVIPQPDDWHVHLRDDAMLSSVVNFTSQVFRYAVVMPNLAVPITDVATVSAYRDRILAAVADDAPDFRPFMTLYCSSEVDLDDLRRGLESGVVGAVKYYPAGATTNSEAGGVAMLDHMALYEVLAEKGARLLVHAEDTDPALDVFDREAAFLDRQLTAVCDRLPELLVTVEHVSTSAGIAFVDDHPDVTATVTPHHLARDRTDLLGDGVRPDLYCKPVINSPSDRAALVAAVTSDRTDVVLGTDSAPHPTHRKYGPKGAAGVFNAPYALEVVAEVFHRAEALDRLAAFVSTNGLDIYGVEPPDHQVRLVRHESPDERPATLTAEGGLGDVVMFGDTEAAHWTVEVL